MDEEFWKSSDRSNVHFDIIYRIGTLLLMHSVTEKKIREFSNNIPWYKKDDSRLTNKHRMKETGMMLIGYRKNIKELTIIGIAKTIEDLFYDLKEKLNIDVNFWSDCNNSIHYEDMKIIRNLSNCIKHSKGIIKRGHNSNDYLIDEANFDENIEIDYLDLDLEKFIYKSFLFQMDVFWNGDKRNNPYKNIKDEDIREILIPDYIEET